MALPLFPCEVAELPRRRISLGKMLVDAVVILATVLIAAVWMVAAGGVG